MCPLRSATLSLVRRTTSILRYEWPEDSAFEKKTRDNSFLLFYDDIYISCTFFKFQPCATQDKFSPSWVMWELNSSKSTGGNSYLLFFDDFYIFCTFCNFESCTMPNKCSPWWVTWELLFHDELNALSTFWKFEPSTTKDNFYPLRVLEITHTTCLTTTN